MKLRLFIPIVSIAWLVTVAFAADPAPKQTATDDEIKARLAEHTKKMADAVAAETPKKNDNADIAAPVAKGSAAKTAGPAPAVGPEPPQVLPKFEVKVAPITELDRQLDKENRESAREKQNTKPTPLDDALNGPKISHALAIFGGQSDDYRAGMAKERVRMIEDEKDLIEEIAQAKTPGEKKELQETLDAIRDMRRDLEHSLR